MRNVRSESEERGRNGKINSMYPWRAPALSTMTIDGGSGPDDVSRMLDVARATGAVRAAGGVGDG